MNRYAWNTNVSQARTSRVCKLTADANAVDIAAYGSVAIGNTGAVLANVYSYGGSVEDVTAVTAYSSVGDIAIDNQSGGSITAVADFGDAVAVDAATGLGSIGVTNA